MVAAFLSGGEIIIDGDMMPIDKIEGSVLRKLDTGWDSIPRAAIDDLQSGEALAIYILLATRPQNWIIRKRWVMQRTGFGEDRYKKGVDELRDKGYWHIADSRDELGKLQGRVVWFSPIASTEVPENRTSGKPLLGENPKLGKTGHINNKDSLKIKERDKDKRGFVLPDGVDTEIWHEFVQHRKDIRKPMTERAMKIAANILKDLPYAEQQATVDRSIVSGWAGLFPEKRRNNTSGLDNWLNNSTVIEGDFKREH